jgi:transposase
MAVGPESAEHQCEWRTKAERLEQEVASLTTTVGTLAHELELLKRRVLGPSSEKLPPVLVDEVPAPKVDFEAVLKTRRERAKAKLKLDVVERRHAVPAEDRKCPSCGNTELTPLGSGKASTLFEYVPARLIARRDVRETLRCKCGEGIVTAPGPVNWQEQSRYGPGFVAHLVTAKCADSIPLYRLEKEFNRLGVPVSRSTMTDLFHAAAEVVSPLSERVVQLVRDADVVHADETPLKVQAEEKCRSGYIWNFRTTVPKPLIAYRFAASRSGETPKQLLGGTQGALVVDGYTGYNAVTQVDGRTRVGCHAHVRRYFWNARDTAREEADQALGFIRDMYRLEEDILASAERGSAEHLKLRNAGLGPIRAAFKVWLDEKQGAVPPKSPLGIAIRYTLNQWAVLGSFLTDAMLPLDNNPAEAALRRVALGRKNFLFVGNDDSGENLAGLYSLVATCEANGVNPTAYLTDVLTRIHEHPNSLIDELLPHNWTGPPAETAAATS